MNWELFKDQFHNSWHYKMQKFVESEKCDKIYEFLKFEARRGKKIAPLSSLTYRAFLETPLNELKVVLVGLCPYHTFLNGGPVADGLAFSCSVTGKLQPSLSSFYQGLECDLKGCLNLDYIRNPDLSYLANQGVLLWNVALTTGMGKAGSHVDLWEPFTRYVLEECLCYTGVPIVFMGKEAQRYSRYASPLTHGHMFSIEHPSYAARNQADWETKGTFTQVTEIVKQNTGCVINWFEEPNNDEPPF